MQYTMPSGGHANPYMAPPPSFPPPEKHAEAAADDTLSTFGKCIPISMSCYICDTDTVSVDWPDGDIRREITQEAADEDPKWKFSKWVWRSTGSYHPRGHRIETRTCLGVLSCSACGQLIRPRTDKNARSIQISHGCPNTLCRDPAAVVYPHDCEARSYHSVIERDDQVFLVWEHRGHHHHPRPPGGRLSKAEESAFDGQVKRRPSANAHQLRTGAPVPGSVPIAMIAPILAGS